MIIIDSYSDIAKFDLQKFNEELRFCCAKAGLNYGKVVHALISQHDSLESLFANLIVNDWTGNKMYIFI